MLFNQDRIQIRTYFRTAWKKYIDRVPLDPLEAIIAEVISIHPEYHAMLAGEHDDLDRDYHPESGQGNPFLHMGMHISLREQASSNRPTGINQLYNNILMKIGDLHQAEHKMIECLGESLWQAQQTGQLPDENVYLHCLKQIYVQL